MEKENDYNIDEETIKGLGLLPSAKNINATLAPNARVFEHPQLDNMFIMESDLYGNPMPKGSCFLAFYGNHGLIGQHLTVETLKNSSLEDLRKLVDKNVQG